MVFRRVVRLRLAFFAVLRREVRFRVDFLAAFLRRVVRFRVDFLAVLRREVFRREVLRFAVLFRRAVLRFFAGMVTTSSHNA